VAVADALQGEGIGAQLKWPNDVLVGDRKLAGILAEASSEGEGIDSIVVGIGVNVEAPLSEDLRETATSLTRETGRAHDVLSVAASVLGRWTLWYETLRGDPARVRTAWRERSIPWWGREVEVSRGGQLVVGIARDIDEGGALLLERSDGTSVAVLSGDARALRAR
jgi:BirA family biotin operon repressor/biotin-[acetyl-CoA-carboxylase] ligase